MSFVTTQPEAQTAAACMDQTLRAPALLTCDAVSCDDGLG